MTVPYAGRETAAPQAPKSPHRTEHNPKSADDVDMEVGRRIRTRRLELRLSQVDIADAVGVSFQQIVKYEQGANRISAGRLHAIAERLEVPIMFFFSGTDPVEPQPDRAPTTTFELLQTRDAVKLLEAFGQITSDVDRKAVVAMAQSLARK
jgi:transcriptional regulator with XRE-family HTH domain